MSTAIAVHPLARAGRIALDLLILAKYRIVFVVVFTGYAAIALQREHATDWAFIWPCILAMALLGGAANTLNQAFELRKDAVMDRTREKRPLPAGHAAPPHDLDYYKAIQTPYAPGNGP